MKFFHLSDLHLGLRLYECSMLNEQSYILNLIYEQAVREDIDAVLIAGDVYDKTVPPVGASVLFDEFLTRLADADIEVFVISGNHDSAGRLCFGASLMQKRGVHISRPYGGAVTPVTVQDEYGEIDIYLLPYIRPSDVRDAHEGCEATTFADAVGYAIDNMNVKTEKRNVILTHQFLLGASMSGSEETVTVGGTDAVPVSLYNSFDYVAAGHIHSPQQVSRPSVRYSGTPLAYSFSENSFHKSVSLVELLEKGNVTISEIPLTPRHPLLVLEESFDTLISAEYRANIDTEAFVEIHLTDGDVIMDASAVLKTYYPNLLRVCNVVYEGEWNEELLRSEEKSPMELIEELYLLQNGSELVGEGREILASLLDRVWREEE